MTLKVLWLWGHPFFCAGGGVFGASGASARYLEHLGYLGHLRFAGIILGNHFFADHFGELFFLQVISVCEVISLRSSAVCSLCRICCVRCHVLHACHVLPTWCVLFTYRVLPVCRLPCFSPHIHRFVLEMLDNQ